MGKSTSVVRKSRKPSSPRLPVRSFLPSWNSHQQYSADRLKISPLIIYVGVENKEGGGGRGGGGETQTNPQNIVLEVQAASKESQRIKLFKDCKNKQAGDKNSNLG